MSTAPRTIAIVEDDSALRSTLVEILKDTPDWQVVATFPNAEAALPSLSEAPPDLVLMDIQMPGMSGIECTAALKAKQPDAHVLVLTVYENTDRVFDALAAGASGYLLKRDVPTRLLESLDEVITGSTPISSSIARKVFQHFMKPAPAPAPAAEAEDYNLTPRETEILDLLTKGKLYKEIASQLAISTETVRYHLNNVYKKLHVRTRTEAVVKYLGR